MSPLPTKPILNEDQIAQLVKCTKVAPTHHNDGEHTLTNVYIEFLIPLWIELQHIERRYEV